MAQLFPPSSNVIAPTVLLGAAGVLLLCAVAVWMLFGSAYATGVGVPIEQPVPFSHQHHVGELGIDCRFCHTAVEVSSSAGVPPTHTCMGCHSQIWTEARMLEPVRQSMMRNQPIGWNRVNRLPDYVYFNHQVHIAKGVGCVSCHGRVDRMPLVAKQETLYMRWCLDCHKHPEGSLRTREQVFQMDSPPPTRAEGVARMKSHQVQTINLLDCSACHR